MAHYEPPNCQAPDEINGQPWRECRHKMVLLGERHPMWRPGHYVFKCPRCEALRVLSEADLGRYARRR